MPDDFNPIKYLTEIGGVFKFGSGVLGKSSIALGILLVGVLIAVWRLHSDLAIIGALVFGASVFFLWFHRVLKFASDHPDLALLDGAEWTGWKRFEAAAKGISPTGDQRIPSTSPQLSEPDDTSSNQLSD